MQGIFAHAKIQKTNDNAIDIFLPNARAASCSTARAAYPAVSKQEVGKYNICTGTMYALSLIGYEPQKPKPMKCLIKILLFLFVSISLSLQTFAQPKLWGTLPYGGKPGAGNCPFSTCLPGQVF